MAVFSALLPCMEPATGRDTTEKEEGALASVALGNALLSVSLAGSRLQYWGGPGSML